MYIALPLLSTDKQKIKSERKRREKIIMQVISENHGNQIVKIARQRLRRAGLIHGDALVRQWVKYYQEIS